MTAQGSVPGTRTSDEDIRGREVAVRGPGRPCASYEEEDEGWQVPDLVPG